MKKAWKLELETMRGAQPVVLEEEEQGWNLCERVEALEDRLNEMKWKSNVPGSGAEEHVLIAAMQDMENMGYDVSKAEALIDEGMRAYEARDYAKLAMLGGKVFRLLGEAPKAEGHPYWKYTIYESFEQYAKAVRFAEYRYDMESEDYFARTYLGWVAQICAGALGTAIEGYTTENITRVFGQIYTYPRTPNTLNDDITYELAFLFAADARGKALTSEDIADQWLALVPFGWSAEDIALRNLKLGIYPPESGYRNNPYREWIGAQMRGAVCGMVAPGNPKEAARLAFLDGCVSHHNNGVLGEVFNAVLVSLAYVRSDITEILEETISAIPADSEYRSAVDFAFGQCRAQKDWLSAWKSCEKRFERYNWIHAYPNAAAEVVALYFGKGDFDETMHIIAQIGYDVDCNAAQIATAVAVMNDKPLDPSWTAPIGDKLRTYMRNVKNLSIRALAEDTVRVGKKLSL